MSNYKEVKNDYSVENIVSSYIDEKDNICGSPANTELRKGKVIDKFIDGHPCKGKKILILRTSSRLPNKKRSTEVPIYDVSTGLRRNNVQP